MPTIIEVGVQGPRGPQGIQGPQGNNDTVSKAQIISALGYTPISSQEAGFSAVDTSGLAPYRLPITTGPYSDSSADAAITAANVTDERAKYHYKRIIQTIKGMGLWSKLDNAYLLGSLHQASGATPSNALKSMTGGSDATGTSTFSDYYATFNGTSDKYVFPNVNAGTALTGKTFIAIYNVLNTSGVNTLVSNYRGGSLRGPILSAGGPTNGAPATSICGYVSTDGASSGDKAVSISTQIDNRMSFAALSLMDGIASTYSNTANPARIAASTAWMNNSNNTLGVCGGSDSNYYLNGQMMFAAVFNTGLTDGQVFAIKCALENILADCIDFPSGIVFEGNSLTAANTGGGSNWPTKLLATTGWTNVKRYVNLSLSGAKQTQHVEQNYWTAGRQWLPMGRQDVVYMLWSGCNDITASISTSKIIASLRRHVIAAKLDGFRVVILTISPVAGPSVPGGWTGYVWSSAQQTQRTDINAWIRTTAKSLGAQVVDLDELGVAHPNFLVPTSTDYYVDGLHQNDAGRTLIAAKFAAEVTPLAIP